MIESRWKCEIPEVSLPVHIFGDASAPLSTTPLWIDAAKPEPSDGRCLSLQSYRDWSKRLAVGLRKAGLQHGDRVLLFSANRLFSPVVTMGVMMAGGIYTGANPGYTARELGHQLRDAAPRFVLAASESLKTAREAVEEAGMEPGNVLYDFDDATVGGSGGSWQRLLASSEAGDAFTWGEIPVSTTAALNYSSGTTGLPKGVEITHANYVANSIQVRALWRLREGWQERVAISRWLCFLPLYHAMAQTFFIITAPAAGIPAYFLPRFDFLEMLRAIERFRITDLTIVPPIAVALAKHPSARDGTFDLSSVQVVSCGAAPLGKQVSDEVEGLWRRETPLKQGWGMTEATCSILGWDPNETVPGGDASVGELLPNCRARIVSETGADAAPGQRGELYISAPNVMKGYWRNEEATRATLVDGWLRSGDIAYVNEEGKFYIVDRVKELIKVKGAQVAPAELEGVLLEHPSIADVAVIGVERDGDEVPRAYVLPGPNVQEGRDDLAMAIALFLEEKVARYKRITGGVVFVDSVPKNPSGKILRAQLRRRAGEGKDTVYGAEKGREYKL